MEEIYRAGGTLQEGFVGQIAYTVCLDRSYEELDIHFTFDKQHYPTATDALRQKIANICREKYHKSESDTTPEELDRLILQEAKTEIHIAAMMNDTFLGCVHRQLTDRHLHFTPREATEGCIPQPSYFGVLKVIVLVFNVILDDTHYELSVSAR